MRTYTNEPVSKEQVETLLRAAMAAPSGMNLQPWRFVVVTDEATKEKLAGGFNKMIAKAPVAIVVCGKTTRAMGGENRNWTADCAAATENLLLAAEAIGLGAVWTACYPYEDRMNPAIEALGLPENVKPYCIVPVGHPGGKEKSKLRVTSSASYSTLTAEAWFHALLFILTTSVYLLPPAGKA